MMYTLPSIKIRRGCKYTATCKEKKGVSMRSYKTIIIHFICLFMGGPYKARGQNCVSGNYMDAVFELRVHQASKILTSLPHSLPVLKKAYYSSQVSRVCVASV